jgi:hypothetical protein
VLQIDLPSTRQARSKENLLRRLTVIALSLVCSTALAQTPWHADGSTRGVQVERRDVPGSHFDALRLTVVSPARLDRLCDAIYPPAFDGTLERGFKRRELLHQTATERWTYEQISVPVVSDRDYVIHTQLNQAAPTGHCEVTFESTTDPSRPPVSGFVRLPVVRGHWDLSPTTDGQVLVRYEIFTEPGGGVPAFLARGGQKSAAIDFFKLILSRASAPGAT